MDKIPLKFVKPSSKDILSVKQTKAFENCVIKDSDVSVVHCKVNNFIEYYDNILSHQECEMICKCIDNTESLVFWNLQESSNHLAQQFRNADTVEISSTCISEEIFRRLNFTPVNDSIAANNIFISESDIKSADSLLERDLAGNWIKDSFNSEILFARYPSSGSFSPHTDGRVVKSLNLRSFYSVILFLNDIPSCEGGGTRFFTRDALENLFLCYHDTSIGRWTADVKFSTVTVEAKAGRLLLFDQCLVHEGLPPLHDCSKYILRSDILYKRVDGLSEDIHLKAYEFYRKGEYYAESGEVELSIEMFKKAFKMSSEIANLLG